MIETNDPPDLARILRKGTSLIKEFKLENEKLLAHDMGRNIRRAYWLTTQLAIRVSGKAVAETALYIAIQRHRRKAVKYREVLERIRPNIQLYNLLTKVNKLIRELKEDLVKN